MKAQFSRDFSSSSSYYQGQISKRRKEGYGIAAAFGPLGLAIAAGIIEGKLVPDLNAKIRNVEHFYADIDKKVVATSNGIDKTKTAINQEIRKIGNLKEATQRASTLIPLSNIESLRSEIIDSAKKLEAKCDEYIKQFSYLKPKI